MTGHYCGWEYWKVCNVCNVEGTLIYKFKSMTNCYNRKNILRRD